MQTFETTPDLKELESKYAPGQDERVHQSLAERTAENSAAFLIPFIKATDIILDVGCGPGTITTDFAKLVPQGSCIGLDASVDALKAAAEYAETREVGNISFVPGDGSKLPFEDNTFDIVYSHQILVHASNPIDIMREVKRVLKRTGFYGAREADLSTISVSPDIPGLSESYTLLGKLIESNGSNPEAGRILKELAIEAGFEEGKIKESEGWLELAKDSSEYEMWGSSGKVGDMIVEKGLASRVQLAGYRQAWKDFGEVAKEDRCFKMKCGEVVCSK